MNKKDLKWREFRCGDCNRLQFKYAIHKDTVYVETKCPNCKKFNIFHINLEPIVDIVNQLKKIERWK